MNYSTRVASFWRPLKCYLSRRPPRLPHSLHSIHPFKEGRKEGRKERTVSDFEELLNQPSSLPPSVRRSPKSIAMARKKGGNSNSSWSSSSSSPVDFQIGNCKVQVQGTKFNCNSSSNDDNTTLEISVSNAANIKIYVKEEVGALIGNYSFLLVNPKDIDSRSKSLLQEVLRIYAKELPAMNYAANTGKESRFLEKCVLNGKYCTLLLQSNATDTPRVVLAAVTYQIIPADTQYAEIPLAAVSSDYQHKGIGSLLYLELSKRLQNIGIRSIFCWGDKESEGFWSRQGFIPIAEVDSKGKARRLPIKADIRRALCFPGGSTLMVSHLNKDISIPLNRSNNSILCLPLKAHINSPESITAKDQDLAGSGKFDNIQNNSSFQEGATLNVIFPQMENTRPRVLAKDESLINDGLAPRSNPMQDCEKLGCWNGVDSKDKEIGLGIAEEDCVDRKSCSCSSQGVKKRVWEASQSSLKSKKVKGCHHADCQLDSSWDHSFEHDQANNSCFDAISLGTSSDKSHAEVHTCSNKHHDQELTQKGESHRIMLMNIANDAKKASLTKIIEGLGGVVVSEGSATTHVITGKARRTLNFCTALCYGAWIISASWLKASFREGKFLDELPFLLQDEEYLLRYSSELKDAVLRAKAHPQALLVGYDIILTKHVEPPVGILSAIVKSAGGNVLRGLNKVHSPSKTIFIACEEDMEEAMIAVKKGIWTYNSDWFMNCVMKQELDLQAPQFAESLS